MTYPVILTQVAQMGAHDHLFAGYEVFRELLGQETMMGLLALSAGVLKLSKEDITLLNDLATINMLGDQRIWPVKLARVVSSYGSALHGFCAGNLMHANPLIGAGNGQRSAVFLQEIMQAIGGADNLDDVAAVEVQIKIIIARERWLGFAVPLRGTDERMDTLKKHLHNTEHTKKPFWRLVMLIEQYLLRTQQCGVYILTAVGALMLDMGFTPQQSGWMMVMMLLGNFSAAAFEGGQQKSEVLQKLPLSFVSYEGSPPRQSPRAQATSAHHA